MSNSLAAVHPELIVEWLDRNLQLTPDSVNFGSTKKVWWKVAGGHEWETSVKARSCLLYTSFSSLDQEINREEQKLGIRLDPEQRTAITTALQSPISVITGLIIKNRHVWMIFCKIQLLC